MEPHTALLCDAHVWLLAECPICALDRVITQLEIADRRIEELEALVLNLFRQTMTPEEYQVVIEADKKRKAREVSDAIVQM